MIYNILSIAGTDPSGGAGIHADLKAFCACGAYGMAAVTAVVAQNTQGVIGYDPVRPALVAAQIDAVFNDVNVHAVKVGMLANAQIINVVAERLVFHGARNIVVDPVMVAKSGHHLLSADAVEAIRTGLLPLATVITPNLPEASALLGQPQPRNVAEMTSCAVELLGLGCQWVLVKGGHLENTASADVLVNAQTACVFEAPRIHTTSDHGTGCTLSAALAAFLPASTVPQATRLAKNYLTDALAAASRLNVGRPGGHGPVHHFFNMW